MAFKLSTSTYQVVNISTSSKSLVFRTEEEAIAYLSASGFQKSLNGLFFTDDLRAAKLESKTVSSLIFGLVFYRLAEYETYLLTHRQISFSDWYEMVDLSYYQDSRNSG